MSLLATADQMRRVDCPNMHRLRREAEQESPLDQGMALLRHAAIHAGVVRRVGGELFRICPVCEARLDRD